MKKIILILLLTFVAVPARALQIDELLSLIAMPLAVAAVAEIADVPPQPLFDLVALLNDAAVPPPQFIEVVRYAPVALVVVDDGRDFVQFVRLRTAEGLRQEALLRALETELRLYGVPDLQLVVSAPGVVEVREDFVPAIVRTRMVERKSHPHGGPPGQLKKAAGVKTGAEIVHGSRPGRDVDKVRVVKKDRDERTVVVDLDRGNKGRDSSGGKKKEGAGPGRGEKGDHGGGKGKGKGKG